MAMEEQPRSACRLPTKPCVFGVCLVVVTLLGMLLHRQPNALDVLRESVTPKHEGVEGMSHGGRPSISPAHIPHIPRQSTVPNVAMRDESPEVAAEEEARPSVTPSPLTSPFPPPLPSISTVAVIIPSYNMTATPPAYSNVPALVTTTPSLVPAVEASINSTSDVHILTLPFHRVPHNPAVTTYCETCSTVGGASVHRVNPAATRNVSLAYFSCGLSPNQHHYVLLMCLCPMAGIVGQLLHSANTHEIHVHAHNHFERWWPIYDAAFRRANVPYRIAFDKAKKAVAANESSYSDVYSMGMSTTVCKNCLRDLVYMYHNLSFNAPCSNVLFIARTKSRSIVDQGALMDRMRRVAAYFDVPLVVFHGNETVPTMTHMFAGACAVVGYHGAGHTNAVLCRRKTLVVEVTTYYKPGDVITQWRSNKGRVVKGMDSPLVWRMYTVGYEHMRPAVDVTQYNGSTKEGRKKWDLLLKSRSIVLGPYHIGNISALVEEHLETLLPRASR